MLSHLRSIKLEIEYHVNGTQQRVRIVSNKSPIFVTTINDAEMVIRIYAERNVPNARRSQAVRAFDGNRTAKSIARCTRRIVNTHRFIRKLSHCCGSSFLVHQEFT
jgi:hypothetical protein